MHLLPFLLLISSVIAAPRPQNNNNAAALTLDPANVQAASAATGQEGGDDPAQADSLTDDANFINFCTGKTPTNGAQVTGGSCNGIVMGDIPDQGNMVSSLITSPTPGEDIAADTSFTVNVKVDGLVAGSFTNPETTYYAAPQALSGGKIVGHTHVTIQKLSDDSFAVAQPPDAATFVFFKGINDAGDGNGNLAATVDEGLPAGFYRVCTMTSSSNHQPVLMPVAQRGAQDDCQKFSVGQGQAAQGQAAQGQAAQGQNGQNQAGQNQAGQNQGQNQAGQNQAGQNQAGQGQAGGNGGNGGNGGGNNANARKA